MSYLKNTLLSNWHLSRWVRLALGIFMAIEAIRRMDALSGILSAVLLFQAATDTGCCGTSACSAPTKGKKDISEEIQFEEIKTK